MSKVMNTIILTLSLLVMIISISSCIYVGYMPAPGMWKRTCDDEPIPRGYETYSMFLFTSYDYKNKYGKDDLNRIMSAFEGFGKSLREKTYATYFESCENGDISVDRSRDLLIRIKKWYPYRYNLFGGLAWIMERALSYDDGPFLVFMSAYPYHAPQKNDFVIIMSFSDMDAPHIHNALNILAQEIDEGKISQSRANVIEFWMDMGTYMSNEFDKDLGRFEKISIILANLSSVMPKQFKHLK